jgi:hypothetical protein
MFWEAANLQNFNEVVPLAPLQKLNSIGTRYFKDIFGSVKVLLDSVR